MSMKENWSNNISYLDSLSNAWGDDKVKAYEKLFGDMEL